MTLLVIYEEVILNGKKIRPARRKPPHITPGFKYNILFILESLVEKKFKVDINQTMS